MSGGRRAVALAVVGLLVGAAVWGLTRNNRDGDPASPATVSASTMISGEARIVGVGDLASLPAEAGHEVFWAGSRAGTDLEYSQDPTGNVHLRYLTDGAVAGDPNQGFLNIGTYPFSGAYEATRQLSQGAGLVKVAEHGGIGFFDPANPYSVIIAWPGQPDLQVEVYDPVKNRALDIVRSGDIVPVS